MKSFKLLTKINI